MAPHTTEPLDVRLVSWSHDALEFSRMSARPICRSPQEIARVIQHDAGFFPEQRGQEICHAAMVLKSRWLSPPMIKHVL